MEKSKIAAWVFGGIGIGAGLVVLYFVCICLFLFRPNFSRAKKALSQEHEIEFYGGSENYQKVIDATNWFESQNPGKVQIESYDGLKLTAYLLEPETECMGTVLLMHGYKSGPLREFAVLTKYLHSLNYRVVLPFQRAHGESEGKLITFGINERFDCRDWILKINALYGDDVPLFVGGISMGCATVTMTSGFPLPDNVRGFIADCGFTSPWEITYWTGYAKYHLPKFVSHIATQSMNFLGKHFFNYDLKGYSTQQALSECDKPFLFISGTEDKTVPCEMTLTNYLLYKSRHPETAGLVLFDGVPHAVSYLFDEEKYNDAVFKFLEKYGK